MPQPVVSASYQVSTSEAILERYAGSGGVASGEEIAVPAQNRVWAHQQPQLAQDGARKLVQQRRQERPVSRSEPHFPSAEVPLQHRDLVPQREDLDVLVSIAHRQQMQHRQRDCGRCPRAGSDQHG